MATNDFGIDPRNKLGADVDWTDGDDWEHFVRALSGGAVVRSASIPGETGAPTDISVDALAQLELRDILSRYK